MPDHQISPVLGVIIMIAITVILAAVISVFVFGIYGQIQKNDCYTDEIHVVLPQKLALDTDVTGTIYFGVLVIDPSRITTYTYNKIRDALKPGNEVTFQILSCNEASYIMDVTVDS